MVSNETRLMSVIFLYFSSMYYNAKLSSYTARNLCRSRIVQHNTFTWKGLMYFQLPFVFMAHDRTYKDKWPVLWTMNNRTTPMKRTTPHCVISKMQRYLWNLAIVCSIKEIQPRCRVSSAFIDFLVHPALREG